MKKVYRTLDLEDGIRLLKGTVFEVVVQAANLSNINLERPDEWDGLRYHNMRQQSSLDEKIRRGCEWGATTPDDMSFGYGAHQCPGRSAACNMLKMLRLKILQTYELRPEEGHTRHRKDKSMGQYVSRIRS